MTGRRAAQGHEEPPGGSAPAPPAQAARPAQAGPTTQPGPPVQAGPPTHPGPTAQPGPSALPGPTTQPGPPALPGQAVGPDQPVEVEPTTGAPVDAVPRRVPVRQPGGRLRRAPAPDEDAQGDDDGLFWAPIEQVHWDGTPLREEHGRRRWWRR
ncbi:hypothetical protein ACFPZ4_16605, partial [Micromonospora harpali]